MSAIAVSVLVTFVAAIILQALLPQQRLTVILVGATACSALAVAGRLGAMDDLWRHVPWNVIAILIGLGVFTEYLLPTNMLGRSAVRACRMSGGSELGLLLVLPVLMFVLSGFVNNLAAMQVLLPVLLAILNTLGSDQTFISLLLSAVLVQCNLGGAATPIGDFPAILLIGQHRMDFNVYLVRAGVAATVIATVVHCAFLLVFRLRRRDCRTAIERRLAVEIIQRLYRRSHVRWRDFAPAAIVFVGMLVAWSCNVPADLVCLVGIAILLVPAGANGDKLIRRGLDIESVLFLVGLFVMIAAVDAAGILDTLAAPIFRLQSSPQVMISVFLLAVGLLTALFSAGPSMAASLPLAERMTAYLPPDAVYVGLALSVCAGSSFFLTAATSGVLTQSHVEAAHIRAADGRPARFGFAEFLPYGLLSFLLIQACAIAYVLAVT